MSSQKNGGKTLVKGALIIALGGFIAKLLGAFYRIPLTNIIGSEGIGIYQLVFPLYSLLLTISSTGIPQSLSKLIAERLSLGEKARADGIFKTSLILFGSIGLIGSILMALFARTISSLQGEPLASTAYLLISPSVFLVSVISCFRGYFQGRLNMLPTSLSQVLEQIIKLGAGLGFAVMFKSDIVKAASFSCLAVTLSELVTVVFLAVLYVLKRGKEKIPALAQRSNARVILGITLPVTLSSILIPMSQLADSFLIINIIGKYSADATALYGLFTGGVMTIIGLPVCLCYGVAASVIPLISSHCAKNEEQCAKQKIMLAIKYTMYISVPAALFCMFFPSQITGLIFGRMSDAELSTMSKILIYASPSVFFLSMVQTLAACLIAKNKQKIAALSMLCGVAVKIVTEIALISDPKISILGGAISACLCYLVAAIINLVYIIRDKKHYGELFKNLAFFTAFSLAGVLITRVVIAALGGSAGFFAGGALAVLAYLLLTAAFKVFNGGELDILKRKKKNNDLFDGIGHKRRRFERKRT